MAFDKENGLTSMKIKEVKEEQSLSSRQEHMQNIDGQLISGTLNPSKMLDNIEYPLVSDDDYHFKQVWFNKNQPVLVSGNLAKAIIREAKGHIKIYNHKEVEEKQRINDVEKMKQEIEELKKLKVEKPVESKSDDGKTKKK